jgi:phage major head subunit gpT-like protein
MRKMNGERIPSKLKAYTYTLVNEEYESSIEVKRADIKDDQTGQYGPLARSIGESARMYPDEVVFGTLLPGGFSTLCYDGQYFFDTDHPVGDGTTQSNSLALDLDATNLATAIKMLEQMKDDSGRPFNKQLDLLLVVGPGNRSTAESLLDLQFTTGGMSNINYKKAQLLVNPWITDDDSWYLINMAGVVKPFVVQEREFIPFEALEDDSEKAFWNKRYFYGTYWRGNFGYGLYQKAVGSTGA